VIYELAEKVELDCPPILYAVDLYDRLGHEAEEIAMGCIYAACRFFRIELDVIELAQRTSIPAKQIWTGYSYLKGKLGYRFPPAAADKKAVDEVSTRRNTGNCEQCGLCCTAPLEVLITEEDISRWEAQGRKDLLQHPLVGMYGQAPARAGGIFQARYIYREPSRAMDVMDQARAMDGIDYHYGRMDACPFLNANNLCSIHETKPEMCRRYTC